MTIIGFTLSYWYLATKKYERNMIKNVAMILWKKIGYITH